jgi:hypothetical protein
MEISSIGAAYSVAVAKKVQASVVQQGEDANKLIESATASKQLPPGVGENLNVKA